MRQFIIALFLIATAPLRAADAPRSKPNIVLIMADDLGYGSLGCYGSTAVKTPHLDALAAGGVRLTDFHSNGPMCSPTRAALLTGRYPQRCAWVPDEELSRVFREQRRENVKQRWAWGISAKELTLPTLLRQAGYRTALIGKWHLGYDAAFHPMNYGFDEFRGFVGGAVDYHTHVATHGTHAVDWWKDRVIQNEPGYATDSFTHYATEFIGRSKAAPFFLYLAHAAPHAPLQGRDAAAKKSPAATYAEMIEALDESVGAIVAALREHGLEKNTLVIFCSDNGPAAPRGFAANGPLEGNKGSLSEGGHRVPFIASWPGVITSGRTSDEPAMSMDLMPTFTKLAAAPIPAGHILDGVDVMPLLKGDAKSAERTLHWQFGEAWAVRRGPWKLTGNRGKARKLVNLADDVSEKSDLLREQPKITEELEKLHQRWAADSHQKN
jgi:arylsulfatase A